MAKKYVKLYPFQVLLRLEEGEDVYMVDRAKKAVYRVNDMCVKDFLEAVNSKDESEPYEFWYESDGESVE